MLKKLLLTGGSGFIGRNLREAFANRYEVLAPGRKELDLLDDEAVRAWMRAHPVDAVIHSATTPGHRNAAPVPDLAYRNLRMYHNLVRNEDCYGRFLFLGSGAAYDMRHYRPKMDESYLGEHIPADAHGFSKYLCGLHAQASGGRVVDLRLFGVFGKYEDWEIRFISNAVCKALAGRPITLKQNRRFDYLFIDDLAPILEHFIENQAAHAAYNLTPERSTELLELARMVGRAAGREVEIQVAEPGLGAEYSGSNARLRAEVPGLRLTPMTEAVAKLYAWYAAHPEVFRPEALARDK